MASSAHRNVRVEDKVFNFKKEFMANLEEYLTCSECDEVPRNATVSWCSAHHLMCKSCYDITRLETGYYCWDCGRSSYGPQCGTCGEDVQEDVECGEDCQVEWKPVLSPFLANVLKELPTKCKFTHNGCQVFIMMKELEVHEVDCVYRNIKCPFRNCKEENVSFIGLDDHLANHEDLKNICKSRSHDFITLLDPIPVWIPQKLVFRNRSFFTDVFHHRSGKDIASQSIHFLIYFHGTSEEAVHYSYRIKITGGNGKELTFKGTKVHSLDMTKIGKEHFLLSPIVISNGFKSMNRSILRLISTLTKKKSRTRTPNRGFLMMMDEQ
jgi:hypothetical protein